QHNDSGSHARGGNDARRGIVQFAGSWAARVGPLFLFRIAVLHHISSKASFGTRRDPSYQKPARLSSDDLSVSRLRGGDVVASDLPQSAALRQCDRDTVVRIDFSCDALPCCAMPSESTYFW